MGLDTQVLNIVATWRSIIEEYSELQENRNAMEPLAFKHWTLFCRLMVSCLPVRGMELELMQVVEIWRSRERYEVAECLKGVYRSDQAAWKVFSALLAHAQGHAECALPKDRSFERYVQETKRDTLPSPSHDGTQMATVPCDIDPDVLEVLCSGDPYSDLRIVKQSNGRPRLRFAAAVPNIPPPAPVPVTSYFRIREREDDADPEEGQSGAATLARPGRY